MGGFLERRPNCWVRGGGRTMVRRVIRMPESAGGPVIPELDR